MPFLFHIDMRSVCPVKVVAENAEAEHDQDDPWSGNSGKAQKDAQRQKDQTEGDATEAPEEVSCSVNHNRLP